MTEKEVKMANDTRSMVSVTIHIMIQKLDVQVVFVIQCTAIITTWFWNYEYIMYKMTKFSFRIFKEYLNLMNCSTYIFQNVIKQMDKKEKKKRNEKDFLLESDLIN